jgi:amino acid transporter
MSVPPSTSDTVRARGVTPGPGDDESMLAELGYKQELHRGMSGFSNFAVSFSIISILAGCITTYYLAMDAGGPLAINTGWLICGAFVLCVALAMAEICSVYPTAGGLYWWAGRLARSRKREWAWFVGWFNFLGEVAVTASIDYGAALTWSAVYTMVTGNALGLPQVFVIFAVLLLLHALLNTFGVDLVKLLSSVSAWWHVVGVGVIVVALWVAPVPHQSLSWTFTHYVNNTGFEGAGGLFGLPIYAFLVGLLMAQYTLTGYDASAHVAEETRNASVEAPKGIVRSVWVSIVAGSILLVSVTAAIQNYDTARTAADANGLPPAQIFLDALGERLGVTMVVICGVAQFFCGMASVTANSRMSYAFSRDNALPGSRLWARINPRTGTPTNSIWLCAALSFILTLPAIWNTTAFFAVTSVAVIGLYIAYATPILLRRLNPGFRQGRWSLGRWSAPIGWIAIVWVGFIVILFLLPQYSPGTLGDPTFNFAPVTVVVVALFALGSWFAGGRKHFMRDVPEGHDTKPAAELLS